MGEGEGGWGRIPRRATVLRKTGVVRNFEVR